MNKLKKDLREKLLQLRQHFIHSPEEEFFRAYGERTGEFSLYKELIDIGFVQGRFNDTYKFPNPYQVKIYSLTQKGEEALGNQLISLIKKQWIGIVSIAIALIALFK